MAVSGLCYVLRFAPWLFLACVMSLGLPHGCFWPALRPGQHRHGQPPRERLLVVTTQTWPTSNTDMVSLQGTGSNTNVVSTIVQGSSMNKRWRRLTGGVPLYTCSETCRCPGLLCAQLCAWTPDLFLNVHCVFCSAYIMFSQARLCHSDYVQSCHGSLSTGL